MSVPRNEEICLELKSTSGKIEEAYLQVWQQTMKLMETYDSISANRLDDWDHVRIERFFIQIQESECQKREIIKLLEKLQKSAEIIETILPPDPLYQGRREENEFTS